MGNRARIRRLEAWVFDLWLWRTGHMVIARQHKAKRQEIETRGAELEADADLAAGRYEDYVTLDEFIASLDKPDMEARVAALEAEVERLRVEVIALRRQRALEQLHDDNHWRPKPDPNSTGNGSWPELTVTWSETTTASVTPPSYPTPNEHHMGCNVRGVVTPTTGDMTDV